MTAPARHRGGVYLTAHDLDILAASRPREVKAYLALRRRMDYATGTVGAVFPVSYQSLAAELAEDAEPGSHRRAWRPTYGEARALVAALERRGLVVRESRTRRLVLRLPTAASDVAPRGQEAREPARKAPERRRRPRPRPAAAPSLTGPRGRRTGGLEPAAAVAAGVVASAANGAANGGENGMDRNDRRSTEDAHAARGPRAPRERERKQAVTRPYGGVVSHADAVERAEEHQLSEDPLSPPIPPTAPGEAKPDRRDPRIVQVAEARARIADGVGTIEDLELVSRADRARRPVEPARPTPVSTVDRTRGLEYARRLRRLALGTATDEDRRWLAREGR